jgi:pimeloyl-ACP methyl ester carboxylesterase
MEYTLKFKEFRSIFNLEQPEIHFPGRIRINNLRFTSEDPLEYFINKSDSCFAENRSFKYSVFSPENIHSEKVILLLHGLNERSWLKYLTWAHYLAGHLDCHVILFPISFHMNRSPVDWKDPRKMTFMRSIPGSSTDAVKSSFVNAALSKRLEEDPCRFFYSGYRTVGDIVKLLTVIKEGKHEVIPKTSVFNIFAYSIGAFLSQILLMGNPENLFSQSKLFIFCGGSVFSSMNGTSKLIMDRFAYESLRSYFLDRFEQELTGRHSLYEFLNSDATGLSFRSMIDLSRLRDFREKRLAGLSERMYVVALAGDKVIPAKGVMDTIGFNKSGNVEVLDPSYQYMHENPFPLLEDRSQIAVDDFFSTVFAKAVAFLG